MGWGLQVVGGNTNTLNSPEFSITVAPITTRLIFCLFVGSVTGLLFTCISRQAIAQSSRATSTENAGHLTSDQIVDKLVQKNLERAQALVAYRGNRTYRLEYHGFPSSRSAEMVVAVKYTSPGKKEFTIKKETGSRLVIERVFHKLLQSEQEALAPENQARVALNRNNYRFALAGEEKLATGLCYILAVEPITKNKLLYRGRVWVDSIDFAVVHIEAVPAKNPSFWTKETSIEQTYAKVGDFWLPAFNRSTSNIRLGGRADLKIEYRDYEVTKAQVENKGNAPATHN